MISEGGKDLNENDSNPTDSIKGGGIGMKLDKRIFVHEDLKSIDPKLKNLEWIKLI